MIGLVFSSKDKSHTHTDRHTNSCVLWSVFLSLSRITNPRNCTHSLYPHTVLICTTRTKNILPVKDPEKTHVFVSAKTFLDSKDSVSVSSLAFYCSCSNYDPRGAEQPPEVRSTGQWRGRTEKPWGWWGLESVLFCFAVPAGVWSITNTLCLP